MTKIHSSAIIHPEAIIGNDVIIGPFVTIGEHVRIGDNTEIMAHAIIEGRTTIGTNNKIFPSVLIGLPAQDLKYKGEPTKLFIGNNNVIREFTTIHLSSTLDDDTIVGDNNLLMAYVHIAHNCQIGSNIVIANAVQLAGHVVIEDNVIIGGLSAAHQFARVGTHAFVGGTSGIAKDIPPYTRGIGYDYKVSGLNSIGLSRRGFSDEQINAIKQIYKIFYHSGRNVSQAIEYAESLPDLTVEQKVFLDFCKSSTRGIVK